MTACLFLLHFGLTWATLAATPAEGHCSCSSMILAAPLPPSPPPQLPAGTWLVAGLPSKLPQTFVGGELLDR